jgi:hypothetical protein
MSNAVARQRQAVQGSIAEATPGGPKFDRFDKRSMADGKSMQLLGARPDRRCDGHLLQGGRLRRPLRG